MKIKFSSMRIFLMAFAFQIIFINQFAFAADEIEDKWEQAEEYFDLENYAAAIPLYLSILKEDPDNANLKYKIGYSYLHSFVDRTKAIGYLEDARANMTDDYNPTSIKEKRAPVDVMFFLGQAYHLDYQFDQAIEIYEEYKTKVGGDEEAIKEIDRMIDISNYAKLLISDPRDITVMPLSDKINTKFPEYAPVLTADEKTILFTSRRSGSTGGTELATGQFYEDIYQSEKIDGEWTEPKPINEINTPYHEATIGLSVDGSQLLIYRDDNGKDGNIYYSKLDGDKWTTPEKMGPTINTKSQETHATFSADGNTIYFTSDRKGGYGGLDIYKVSKLPNGEWGRADNLGPMINTKYDDRAPFMHPDGVSLFFSSEGHQTMGGFDIFMSVYDEVSGTWMEPENIGYPINTTDNDIFYVTSTDAKRAYYASHKTTGKGSTDIYMISMPIMKQPALALMTGYFSMGDKEGSVPDDAQIIVTDNETGEIVGIYKPNSKTGKYLFILPPGKNYNVTYEAENYLFHSDNIIIPDNAVFQNIEAPVKLAPIKAGESIVLNNIFFEFDKANITAESEVELQKLFRLMNNNQSVKIEIQGHTDSKGSDSYNKRLSQDRAQAVVNYLIEKGIAKNRMVAKGYGESQPIAKNTNPDGTDNPEGRALNRRIELKITESDGKKDIVNDIVVPKDLKDE